MIANITRIFKDDSDRNFEISVRLIYFVITSFNFLYPGGCAISDDLFQFMVQMSSRHVDDCYLKCRRLTYSQYSWYRYI